MRQDTWKKVVVLSAAALLLVCENYPIEPVPQLRGGGAQETALGTLAQVNYPYQICNPSITQDEQNFPGCFLWLGFDNLGVKVPAGWQSEYSLSNVVQHDRLTISDFSDSLRWFLMRDDIPGIAGHMQDPEWAAHPHYLVFLGSSSSNNVPGSWSGYVVRTVDNDAGAAKQWLQINRLGLFDEATPHVWIGNQSAPPEDTTTGYDENGFVSRYEVWQYFGTDSVIFTYSLNVNGFTLYYVDYASVSLEPVQLPKPAGRELHKVEDAMISPDGYFVTYNIYTARTSDIAVYVQRLQPGAPPVLLAEPGADPNWWYYNNRYYVLYSTRGGVTLANLLEVDDGSAGVSMRQELSLAPLGPLYIQISRLGSPVEVLPYPFKGGLSPSGFYMCTGYRYAYLFRYN